MQRDLETFARDIDTRRTDTARSSSDLTKAVTDLKAAAADVDAKRTAAGPGAETPAVTTDEIERLDAAATKAITDLQARADAAKGTADRYVSEGRPRVDQAKRLSQAC